MPFSPSAMLHPLRTGFLVLLILSALRLASSADLRPAPDQENQVLWRGDRWVFLDDQGVFVTSADTRASTAPLPVLGRSVEDILSRRTSEAPIECRLVDFVDATDSNTHAFRDDGESRVLDLPSGRFRVTGVPKGFELKWFSYTIQTANRAGQPHLLVYELSNDRERYTTINLTTPRKEPWAPPYAGQETVRVDAMQLTQEPLWYEPDVGLSVYTGRDLPLDNRPFLSRFIFHPKTARLTLTVSSSGWDLNRVEETGGAVRRIWVYEITKPLPPLTIPAPTSVSEKQRRHFGVYTTHPWYFLGHYGVPPHTPEQRAQSLTNMLDTLAFSGVNLIEFNAINGSDRAGRAWYPGSYYSDKDPNLPNLLKELPPLASERDIDLIPVVTSITAPKPIHGDRANEYGFSNLSFQHPADPESDPRAFENRAPDPLRPETQQWVIRHLLEIAERSKAYGNVLGVGFRVNGKIGTCYISGEDKRGKDIRIIPASEMGYSPWNLQEFEKDTGVAVHTQFGTNSIAAHRWLRADAMRWDRWLDYRCRKTRAFWLAARDAIRSIRADWNLYVLTDLPSEVQATNIDWPGPDAPPDEARHVTLDLLRAHGYDPRLFTKDEGLIIQRVMMIDMERYFSKWGPPFGSNPERYRAFHEQEFLGDWYRTPAGAAVEMYHTYWEEPFHPQGEFGPDGRGFGLRTATAMAKGRDFFRPLTFALRANDVDSLVLMGWTRPTLGRETDLRSFARAFRAIPFDAPTPLAVRPARPRLTATRRGDQVLVLNDRPEAATVEIRLDEPLPLGHCVVEATDGDAPPVIGPHVERRDAFELALDAYDLRVFRIERKQP